MAMMQEQEWRALVQRWRQTLSEHKDSIRGEYDPALDTYYLTIGALRPAGTIELADVLLRIDLQTGDLVGFEFPDASRLLKQQPLAGEDLPMGQQESQRNLRVQTLQRAEAALTASDSLALEVLV